MLVCLCIVHRNNKKKEDIHWNYWIHADRLWITFVYIFVIILIFLQCANVIETKKAFNLSLSNYIEPEENDKVQN